MIGNGSVIIISVCAFVSIAAIAGIYIVQKKRRVAATTADVKIIVNNGSSDSTENGDSE
jgi:hypothetical protein